VTSPPSEENEFCSQIPRLIKCSRKHLQFMELQVASLTSALQTCYEVMKRNHCWPGKQLPLGAAQPSMNDIMDGLSIALNVEDTTGISLHAESPRDDSSTGHVVTGPGDELALPSLSYSNNLQDLDCNELACLDGGIPNYNHRASPPSSDINSTLPNLDHTSILSNLGWSNALPILDCDSAFPTCGDSGASSANVGSYNTDIDTMNAETFRGAAPASSCQHSQALAIGKSGMAQEFLPPSFLAVEEHPYIEPPEMSKATAAQAHRFALIDDSTGVVHYGDRVFPTLWCS
jgi:hypothetical protein